MISVKIRVGDDFRRFPLPESLSALRENVWKRCTEERPGTRRVLTLLSEVGDTLSAQEDLDALVAAAKTSQSHCIRLSALIEELDAPPVAGSPESWDMLSSGSRDEEQEQLLRGEDPSLGFQLDAPGLLTNPPPNPADPSPSPSTAAAAPVPPPTLVGDQAPLVASMARPAASFDSQSVDLDLTLSVVSEFPAQSSSIAHEAVLDDETAPESAALLPGGAAAAAAAEVPFPSGGASSAAAALDPLYVSLKDVPLDEALRIFLTRTFLPRNPSTRAAVLSVFGREYMDQNPDLFPSLQCVIGVSERLLWLSERLHDPAQRATVNRGVFLMEATLDGDFPIDVEPLADMYKRIDAAPLLFLKPDEDELRLDEATDEDAVAAARRFAREHVSPVPSESAYTDSECESMIVINGKRVPQIADGSNSVALLGDDHSVVGALEASFFSSAPAQSPAALAAAAAAAVGEGSIDELSGAFDLDQAETVVMAQQAAAAEAPASPLPAAAAAGADAETAEDEGSASAPLSSAAAEANATQVPIPSAPPACAETESSCGSVFDPEIEFKEAERPPQPYNPAAAAAAAGDHEEGDDPETGEPDDEEEALAPWKCLYCTYENLAEHLQCNVCFSERPHRPHQLVEQARQRHLLRQRRDPFDGTICGAVRDLGAKVRKQVHRTLSNLDEFVAKRKPSWPFASNSHAASSASGPLAPPAPQAPQPSAPHEASPPVAAESGLAGAESQQPAAEASSSASGSGSSSSSSSHCASAGAVCSSPSPAPSASESACVDEERVLESLVSSFAGCVDDDHSENPREPAASSSAAAAAGADSPPPLGRVASDASSECSSRVSFESSSVFVQHSDVDSAAGAAAAAPAAAAEEDEAADVAAAAAVAAAAERVKDDIIARLAQRLDALEQQNRTLSEENVALKRKADAEADLRRLQERRAAAAAAQQQLP